MNKDSQNDPRRLGKYELRELLGRGGMAEVWKAYDPQLDRYVAIKILHSDLQADPEFNSRFSREARVIASLHHPNIIQVHDFQISHASESSSSTAYMVMDYIEGQTLAKYILTTSRVGKFPSTNDIVFLFSSISRAVDYAHQQGMIHRDIKPANILLDQRNLRHNPIGEPILTDFGIAKLMGVASGTASGTWIGTPLYTSPEQIQGHPGNERSDIYSLGVILYEICTGVQPFRGENISAVMMQHINSMPISPVLINPNVSPALAAVILRSIAKNPADRFSSASAMTAALAEALNMPVPSDMGLSWNASEAMSGPTYLSPIHQSLPPTMTPSSSSFPYTGSRQLPPAQASTVLPSVTPSGAGQINPVSSGHGIPGGPYFANSMQSPSLAAPTSPPASVTPVIVSSPPPQNNRRKGLLFKLAILLIILLLLGSGLGGLYWFTNIRNAPAATTKPIVGYAYFFSSGQIYEHSNQGINDEMLIELQNIAAPASGKSYYAWLLPDQIRPLSPSVSLGKLTVVNGNVHYLYQDPNHTNLLAITSRFLITEEDANTPPISPSPDKSVWRYYAQFPQPQIPDSMSMTSDNMMQEAALYHTRHLLADAPELTSVGISGGLDIWLFRNAEKVHEWSGAARDAWERNDVPYIQGQIIRILDYLDGKVYVQQDLPAGTPNLVNPRLAPLALLQLNGNQQPPGLLYLIDLHLSALVQAPGISQAKHVLAGQIDRDVNNVEKWLQQVRTDAKQIYHMTAAQILTPTGLSLLDDMESAGRNAFIGELDPNTNTIQGGVVQIHDDIQHLATYEITPM